MLAVSVAAGLAFSGLTGVSAATLEDVFDAEYYAETYSDLKEAFGYDRDALWNHFITYGLAEGRSMNSLIDLEAYRAAYPDLNEAFGDDWEAYLNHYLTYGAKEGRDSGTGFDAMDYAARYPDLQKAFGEVVLALWKHYEAFGVNENREARDEGVVEAERAAVARAAAERAAAAARAAAMTQTQESVPGESAPEESVPEESEIEDIVVVGGFVIDRSKMNQFVSNESGGYRKIVWYAGGEGFLISDYDGDKKEIGQTLLMADGSINYIRDDYGYDSAGRLTKYTQYGPDGSIQHRNEFEYDSTGKRIWRQYGPDGSLKYEG